MRKETYFSVRSPIPLQNDFNTKQFNSNSVNLGTISQSWTPSSGCWNQTEQIEPKQTVWLMSAEVSVLKRRAASGSQITDTFWLPPSKDSITLINLSGQRNNSHILIWEAITGFVQRQPPQISEKSFWGWFWALQSVAKSSESNWKSNCNLQEYRLASCEDKATS